MRRGVALVALAWTALLAQPATAVADGEALVARAPAPLGPVPARLSPSADAEAESVAAADAAAAAGADEVPALPVASEAERLLFPPQPSSPPLPAGPHAPPRLLWPHTPPDSRVTPLVRPPVLATREPIPRRGAGNCVRRDEQGRFLGWMDHQQCVFSGRALVTARWIDDFFGDWYDDEATMMARLVFHTTLAEAEGLETKATLRASATLPNARHRLRLIVTDESDETLVGQDVRRQLGQEDSRVSAAVRWLTRERDGLESSFDVGVRGVDPPEVFARYRLRKTWSLGEEAIARLTQTLRYGSDTRDRYTPVLDLEHLAGENSVLRLSNYYDYRGERPDDGFNWTHGLSLSKALANSRSFSYGWSVAGHTRPGWRGESHGPWAIYRRPFLRPWLYLEVEPHYTWYRERDWEGLASLIVRLEVQFGWKD